MPSMSSAARYQGLQSCLEPWQAHPLKKTAHKWVWPPQGGAPADGKSAAAAAAGAAHVKEVAPPPLSAAAGGNGNGNGGWSSLYSLSQPSQSPLEVIDKSSYKTRTLPGTPIPTTSYANSHQLCKKNWELCTETLGCETGAAYTLRDFPASIGGSDAERKLQPKREEEAAAVGTMRKRRSTASSQFPPPLTTLSGFRLKSRREEGRLLLLPFNPNVFQAERKDGRLRLRLLPAAGGGAEEKKTEEEEEEDYLGVVGREMNGSPDEVAAGKYRRAGVRCKEEEVAGPRITRRGSAMLDINYDALWVSTS